MLAQRLAAFICLIFALSSVATPINTTEGVQEDTSNHVYPLQTFAQARVNSAIGLRMRSQPGTYGNILQVIPDKTLLPVVGRSIDKKWLMVTYNGLTGWVSLRYLYFSLSVEDLPILLPLGLTGRPAFSYANMRIRELPGVNSRTIFVLPKLRPVGAIGLSRDKKWVLINYSTGLNGWAYKDFFIDATTNGKLRSLPIIQ